MNANLILLASKVGIEMLATSTEVSSRQLSCNALSPDRNQTTVGVKEGSKALKMPGKTTRPAKVQGAQRSPLEPKPPTTLTL